jgi:hypothetical protein
MHSARKSTEAQDKPNVVVRRGAQQYIEMDQKRNDWMNTADK